MFRRFACHSIFSFAFAFAVSVLIFFFVGAVTGHETDTIAGHGTGVAWGHFTRFLDVSRGSQVSGMAELKKYFHRFGYLPISTNNFSDAFDDQFESAVILYQKKFGLAATGKLDSVTLSTIMAPRCGMSDSVGPVHVTRHYAFFSDQPRWFRASTLTYAFSPHNSIDYLTMSEIRSVFVRSFGRWSEVIPMNFTETNEYETADIRIGFYLGDHGDGEPFDGVLGILAHAFSPENGRLHLDSSERWAVDFNAEKSKVAVDLESVATHEIGHVLGLAHSAVKEAVMYPSLSPRTKKMDLKMDDVAGIQALYGSNPNFKMSSFLEAEKSSNKGFGLGGMWSTWNYLFSFVAFFLLLSGA